MKYICKESFPIDVYDDDGFCIPEKSMWVKEGTVFEKLDSDLRLVGGFDTIRLESEDTWIEITEERLNDYFEVVDE